MLGLCRDPRRLLTPRSEWVSHHHRDTYATIIGLPSLLSYAALADGEAPQRVKFEYCEVRWSACDACCVVGQAASDAGCSMPSSALTCRQRMLAPIGPPPETVRLLKAVEAADALQED